MKIAPVSLARLLSPPAFLATLALACACDDGGGGGPAGAAPTTGVVLREMCDLPPDCGGDLYGTWEVVGGCAQAPASSFECDSALTSGSGSVEGRFTFEEGGFDSELDTELRQCGWISDSGSGSSGSLAVDDNALTLGGDRALTFCVEGDTLWLYEASARFPDLAVLRLQRAEGGAVDGG